MHLANKPSSLFLTSEEADGKVLNILKFIEEMDGCAIEDAATIIDA